MKNITLKGQEVSQIAHDAVRIVRGRVKQLYPRFRNGEIIEMVAHEIDRMLEVVKEQRGYKEPTIPASQKMAVRMFVKGVGDTMRRKGYGLGEMGYAFKEFQQEMEGEYDIASARRMRRVAQELAESLDDMGTLTKGGL